MLKENQYFSVTPRVPCFFKHFLTFRFFHLQCFSLNRVMVNKVMNCLQVPGHLSSPYPELEDRRGKGQASYSFCLGFQPNFSLALGRVCQSKLYQVQRGRTGRVCLVQHAFPRGKLIFQKFTVQTNADLSLPPHLQSFSIF